MGRRKRETQSWPERITDSLGEFEKIERSSIKQKQSVIFKRKKKKAWKQIKALRNYMQMTHKYIHTIEIIG